MGATTNAFLSSGAFYLALTTVSWEMEEILTYDAHFFCFVVQVKIGNFWATAIHEISFITLGRLFLCFKCLTYSTQSSTTIDKLYTANKMANLMEGADEGGLMPPAP